MSGLSFLTPWGLLGLTSLVAVGVIYLFYQRFRERPVTGLFLWDAPALATRGGRRFATPRATRSLLLDVLAVILLALALGTPAWVAQAGRTLVVVLDDSLSMRAAENHESVRKEVDALIRGHGGGVLLIAAGETVRVLADQESTPATVRDALAAWNPYAVSDSVSQAITLAVGWSAGPGEMHIFTDQPLVLSPKDGCSLTLHRYAGRRDNRAIVDAERRFSAETGKDQVLACIANYAASKASLSVVIRTDAGVLARQQVDVASGGIETVLLDLPPGTGAVTVEMEGGIDALQEDSFVTLLPEPRLVVTGHVALSDDGVADMARRALRAAGILPSSQKAADVLVTDAADTRGRLATVRLVTTGSGTILAGPWVTDFSHELCRDFHLDGVYWACDESWRPSEKDITLLRCGDIPLVTYAPTGVITLNLHPARSNIMRTSAWPVLMANVVRMAREHMEGLHRANYRSGALPRFVRWEEAAKNPTRIQGEHFSTSWPMSGVLPVLPQVPGLYGLFHEKERLEYIQVNVLAPGESDLRLLADTAGVERVSDKLNQGGSVRTVSLAWVCVLLAMLLLALNWWLDDRERRAMLG